MLARHTKINPISILMGRPESQYAAHKEPRRAQTARPPAGRGGDGMTGKVVRIGAGTAFVNDSMIGMQQMLACGDLDYIVLEYLAEGVMAWLAADEAVKPGSGYSPYLVDVHVGPNLATIMAQGVKIVTNAGGLNPHGSAEALRKCAAALGLNPKIAVVEGDDLRKLVPTFREEIREMYSGAPFPEKVTSANAYLGGFPIAQALAA